MTTDAQASYYDLDINGATVETRDIVRAVLERAGLGAHASHQLGKVLERCIRLGAKPGTDVPREVEKIHIEAGMLRDAVGQTRLTKTAFLTTPGNEVSDLWKSIYDSESTMVTFEAGGYRGARNKAEIAKELASAAEPITDDDAEDAARVERCETCDAKVTTNRQGCPICGAPTCCYSCCSREELKRQLDEARARIAELERKLDEAQAAHARAQVHINELCLEPTRLRSQAAQAERERDEACERAARAESSRSALRDRYRPRRQSEEPAPQDEAVLYWREHCWLMIDGAGLRPNDIWTPQPPAPEAEREVE